MHTHFSVMSAAQVFLSVLVIGTLWRLVTLHMVASDNTQIQHLGRAFGFQY
jgi:hypothetical protein